MHTAAVRGLGWYCLANAVLLKLTTLYYSDLVPPATTADVQFYRLLVDLSHWLFLALVFIGLPLLALIATRLPRAWILAGAALCGSATVFLLVFDGLVFTQYRMHLGSYVWVLLFGGSGRETLYSVATTAWMTLLGVFAVVVALQILLVRRCWKLGAARVRYAPGAWLAAGWACAFVSSQLWHVWADAKYDVRITAQSSVYPFYSPRTAKRLLRKLELVNPEDDRPQDWGELSVSDHPLIYPSVDMQCVPSARPNILLVIIDAWRADQLNPVTTPALHRFAGTSTTFTQHISASNSTRIGIFSIFYGLMGNDWFPILRTQTSPVLMRELVDQGYELAIFGSAPLVQPEFDRTVFSGIDDIRLRTPGDRPHVRDRRITADMLRFLDGRTPQSAPFFGFLWYNSAHAFDFPTDKVEPFLPSKQGVNYFALNRTADATPYFNRYRNALHFIDAEVAQVLDALESRGDLENTLVLITSDHGQEFNDTGKNYWGHNSNFSPYQVHVPLIARWKNWAAGSVPYMTSHYDLAPSLLTEALGCTTPPHAYSHGLPLMQSTHRPAFVPVFDYDQMGVYQADRITLVSRFGGFEVYSHHYDPLDVEADLEIMEQVSRRMLHFSRRPEAPKLGAVRGAPGAPAN